MCVSPARNVLPKNTLMALKTTPKTVYDQADRDQSKYIHNINNCPNATAKTDQTSPPLQLHGNYSYSYSYSVWQFLYYATSLLQGPVSRKPVNFRTRKAISKTAIWPFTMISRYERANLLQNYSTRNRPEKFREVQETHPLVLKIPRPYITQQYTQRVIYFINFA